MRLAPKDPSPFPQTAAQLLQAFTGNQARHVGHQFVFKAHALGDSFEAR